ncbi:MAG: hypothetical protein H0V17_27520 [Deltaproteobacteria bacterium]|nr:hypothetical protein [Deltaproteobacteria bacterium]
MLSRLIVAFVLAIVGGIAVAAPASQRVVLVDPDPELLRAMTTALRPWKLQVIVDKGPVDEAGAAARADALSARFVVWRKDTDLVVFDRERGDSQHRDAPAGALDPVAAASAALTVKTLMRLPPPPEDERPPPPPPPPATPPIVEAKLEMRVQAGFATRFAQGSDTAIGGRFVGAALVRPIGNVGWRFGLMGDVGTPDKIQRAGFDGDWSDWALLALASWTHVRRKLEIEPFLGAGIARSRFSGEDNMGGPRDERETLAALRVGGWVRWRFGGTWTVGGAVSFETSPGTPTYTKANNGPVIYEVPSFGVSVGVVVAADLGR